MGFADKSHATFDDGIYTLDKELTFLVKVKAGDVVSVDYESGSDYITGRLQIKTLDNAILHETSNIKRREGITVEYEFISDYEGFLVVSRGDKSIKNKIYEVRLNDEMIFDGHNFITATIDIDSRFIQVRNLNINSADITFDYSKLPKNLQAKEILLLLEDEFIVIEEPYKLKELQAGTKYEYDVRINFDDKTLGKLKFNFTTPEIDLNDFVSARNITDNSARLNFDFSKLQVSPQRIEVYDENARRLLRTSEPYYQIRNLSPETSYKYTIKVVFDTKNAAEQTIEFTTLEPNKEVSNLTATPTAYDVLLTWEMPNYESLEKVRVYRKNKPKPMARLARLLSLNANDGYQAIFETNGTNFKDLTVEPDSEYIYKVTTVAGDSESEGKEITVRTKQLSVVGGGIEEDQDTGDYLISWEQPTKGKVLVQIAGKDYKTVNASDLKILIPKKDMKYNILGAPDVKIVPIDENGNLGVPSKPDNSNGLNTGTVKLPDQLTAENVLKSGVSLVGIVGLFILLGLAFRVVPKLIKMIRISYEGKRGDA